MATKKKAAKKTKAKGKGSKSGNGNPGTHNWYLVLQQDGDKVRVQPDWTTGVREGDTVSFISPDGKPVVTFTTALGMKKGIKNGVSSLPLGINQLGKKEIEGSRRFRVMRSCSGMIQCSLELPANEKNRKEKVSYGEKYGANICWKGSTPVTC